MKNQYNVLIVLAVLNFLWPAIVSAQARNTAVRGASSMEEALGQPWGKNFYIGRENGRYTMGDTLSQYNDNKDFQQLSFDISNNKVLANMGILGTLKNISMFRDSYFANCGPSAGSPGGWPGVWAAKDNSSFGPYHFTVETEGHSFDLDSVNWDFKTGLLDNLFPITELNAPGNQYTITLIAYAPLSADGSERTRGLVYGLFLKNRSAHVLSGKVLLPKLFAGRRQTKAETTPWSAFDPYDFEVITADTNQSGAGISFNLKKDQSVWVPAVFTALGDTASIEEIRRKGTLACLNETHAYFRRLLGDLQTPGDNYLGEFYERQMMEAFGSLAISANGKFAGSNWGSSPTTRQIWMKDCYYSSLPFMRLDPNLARKLIGWFDEYGVRPRGSSLMGGVNHSVGLSVSPVILAGYYYQYSGDKEYFLTHPQLMKHWGEILRELVASRQDSSVWLFPSRYISDGPIDADYHTGSNVCAWAALTAYAGLLKNIYRDKTRSDDYFAMAGKVHAAILEKCTVDGPYGHQFIEGTYRDGRKPLLISDGEESDITLMPFYGFLSYDDPVYLNYMKFSMSSYNHIYEPQLHAISWFGVPSTAPGYMKGICGGTDYSSLFAEHGAYREVRNVTDADGSIWWWSYGWASEVVSGSERAKKTPDYGRLVRGVPGKAGWFSGIHSLVFLSRFAGIDYDDTRQLFSFAPFSPSSDLSWTGLSVGGHFFDAAYAHTPSRVMAVITNQNDRSVSLQLTLPVKELGKKYSVTVNDVPIKNFETISYLNAPVIRLITQLSPGSTVLVVIKKK